MGQKAFLGKTIGSPFPEKAIWSLSAGKKALDSPPPKKALFGRLRRGDKSPRLATPEKKAIWRLRRGKSPRLAASDKRPFLVAFAKKLF
jgi:hypothetical protein